MIDGKFGHGSCKKEPDPDTFIPLIERGVVVLSEERYNELYDAEDELQRLMDADSDNGGGF